MKNYVWMLGLMLCTLTAFTSCDEDEEIGLELKGRWFGDMDMWYDGNEKAIGSEIEFIPYGWGYDKGTGEEVDYYRRGTVIHNFDYRIRDGVIYMTFDDPDLDCAIVDYRLSYNYFSGYIADYFSLENRTHFNLRNYDRYWDQYGYGRYYNVKGDKFNTDQTVSGDSIATQTGEEPRYIRGVNRQRD